jgi:MFS transporter, DHA3 family, macrolide efflux protein
VTTTAVANVLQNREFRLLWLAQMISSFGDALTGLTLLILVNQITGSTAAIATLSIVMAVPSVTLGLIAGVYADRLDRRTIMLVSDAVRAVIVLGLAFVGAGGRLWVIYILGAAQATVGTFFGPARGALVQHIVPEDQRLQANSLSQTSIVIAGVIGSSLAGAIIGLTGQFWIAFVLDAATFMVSFALVLRVRSRPPEQHTSQTRAGILNPLLDGLRVISGNRTLSAILIATGVTMFGLGAVNVLFVPFVVNVLRVPVAWLGALEAAETVGMVVSGAVVVGLAARLKPSNMIVLGLGALASLTAAIGIVPDAVLFGAIMLGFGLAVVPLQAAVGTLMQSQVPNELMGRVGGSFNTVANGANLISMAVAGALGAVVGVRNVFLVGGAIVALAVILAAWMLREDRSASVPNLTD